MYSMTGYGRGEALLEGLRFIVEIQSINRKQSDIALSIPRSLQALEPRIREKLQSKISRGRLNASIQVEAPPAQLGESAINESLAAAYLSAINRLRDSLALSGEVTLDLILRAPGVLQTPTQNLDPEVCWPALDCALERALEGLISMRKTEGLNLASDLRSRLALLKSRTAEIRGRAPEIAKNYRSQLLDRIANSELPVSVDEERLVREVVLFADKSDISEELTRLDSHAEQFASLIERGEPIGRTLEFLTQEIARELNTLGTKSNDAQISHWVVQAKAELEKIREQLLNIE